MSNNKPTRVLRPAMLERAPCFPPLTNWTPEILELTLFTLEWGIYQASKSFKDPDFREPTNRFLKHMAQKLPTLLRAIVGDLERRFEKAWPFEKDKQKVKANAATHGLHHLASSCEDLDRLIGNRSVFKASELRARRATVGKDLLEFCQSQTTDALALARLSMWNDALRFLENLEEFFRE